MTVIKRMPDYKDLAQQLDLYNEALVAAKEPRKQKEPKLCPGCQAYRAVLTEIAYAGPDNRTFPWIYNICEKALAEV